jgi:elongator complex protein 3
VKNENLIGKIYREICEKSPRDFAELEKIKNKFTGAEKISTISNSQILQFAQNSNQKISPEIRRLLRTRKIRTLSGVAVIAVLTPPAGCPGNCVFCPQEISQKSGTLFDRDLRRENTEKISKKFQKPGAETMPKSYFSNEPAAARALLAGFDPFRQIQNRLKSLRATGHRTDKIELIILGGTFSALLKNFRRKFVRRLFESLNSSAENFAQKIWRRISAPFLTEKFKLARAQKFNETAKHRCVVATIETRPDFISPKELKFLRELGVTKVELGIQSLDDEVLRICRRGHGKKESAAAIELLRNAGFKIGAHFMPGLPDSNSEKDFAGFRELFDSPKFRPDFLKIYPTTVVPFSELEKWERAGKFRAATEKELIPLLTKMKLATPEYCRISRLIRDIPATTISAGNKTTNLRQLLADKFRAENLKCRCIRCREIRDEKFETADLKILKFDAAGGKEFFLQFCADEKLVAFLRLRILPNSAAKIFKELKNCAIVRELRTCGAVVSFGEKNLDAAQHFGFGKKLLAAAENLTRENSRENLAVIAAAGVKNFYRKLGFADRGDFLVKKL